MSDGDPGGFTETDWQDQSGRRWTLRVWWAEIDGRMEPVGFGSWKGCREDGGTVLPLPATTPQRVLAADLRGIPFAQIVGDLRQHQAAKLVRAADMASAAAADLKAPSEQPTAEMAETAQLAASVFAALEAEATRTAAQLGGSRRLSTEYLARVAAAYGAAWTRGQNPTKAVAATLSLPYSTAAHHVAAARAAGLLEGVSQGRPGGVPRHKTKKGAR